MTIEEIDALPWARRNVPRNFDFRNKSADDLAPLCFGAYVKCDSPKECKIVYGGSGLARAAIDQLAKLGITGRYEPPFDSFMECDEQVYKVRGWSYNIHFTLP